MNIVDILKLIFGEAEAVIPIWIHDPATQKIAGVVATTAANAAQAFGTTATKTPAKTLLP